MMIKRILTAISIYAIGIVIIILFIPSDTAGFIISIVLTGLLLTAYVGYEVYKRYFPEILSTPSVALQYTQDPVSGLYKISQKPFLFGLEKRIISGDELYFDNNSLYAVNQTRRAAIFSLRNITELKRTSVRINNNRIWQVKILHEGQEVLIKFAHNFSLSNHNFLNFYTLLKEINPTAIQSEWNLWKM